MWLRQIQGYLLPGAAESEEGFRQVVQKQSLFGLKVAAGVTVGVSMFLTFSRSRRLSRPACSKPLLSSPSAC